MKTSAGAVENICALWGLIFRPYCFVILSKEIPSSSENMEHFLQSPENIQIRVFFFENKNVFQHVSHKLAKIGDVNICTTSFFHNTTTNIVDIFTFLEERLVKVFTQKKLKGFKTFFLPNMHISRKCFLFSTFFPHVGKNWGC